MPTLGAAMDQVRATLPGSDDPEKRAAGLVIWQMIAYEVFGELQDEHEYDAISFAVMDIHDYLDVSCNHNVASTEISFDVTDPMLPAFIDALIAYEKLREFNGKPSSATPRCASSARRRLSSAGSNTGSPALLRSRGSKTSRHQMSSSRRCTSAVGCASQPLEWRGAQADAATERETERE
jgi:hypothetical protein